MGLIQGAIGLPDSDNPFISTVGQSIVYDGSQQLLASFNADLQSATGIFIESSTSEFKTRYKLAGGGRLQRRQEQTATQAVKASGSWDVAFPLEDFGARLMSDDVTFAYMTLNEYNLHLDTIFIQAANTYRFEMLKALFNNAARTFLDPLKGSLTVQPLANLDGTLYPPVLGSEADADDQHYVGSNYVSASISNSNNPYITIVNELEEHFGATQGGSNIVAFINPAETAVTAALAGFVPYTDNYIIPGDNTAVVSRVPRVPASARVVGRTNGCWVVEWRWIPAGYILGVHDEAPAPLRERVDPAETGLGGGLKLVATNMEFPMESSHYRWRFGLGVANRLNGVVIQLVASTSYTTPAIYA